jgi:3-deoxy-D-manno-octulosonic-acid transferase
LQRLGFLPRDVTSAGSRSPIWIHAVSVGEANAARPLVALLRERHTDRSIILSTVTDTGQEIARAMPELAGTFYFPIDLRICCQRVISMVRPSLVILVETEIWPNFLRELRQRRVPVALVNGRISDRSFPRYRWGRRWLRPVLESVAAFLAQTETDAERFRQIGAPPDRIVVVGSLKFDGIRVGEARELRSEWRGRLGVAENEILIVAGSTFEGEEEILVRVWRQVGLGKAVRLVLAPRRPERFNSVAGHLERTGVRFVRRSQLEHAGDNAPVILLDTVGELPMVYAAADMAFVGKSLCGVGGQNPLEAAAQGVPVVFGPHMENFRAAAEILLSSRGAVQVQNEAELARTLLHWVGDAETRGSVGRNAVHALARHTGAANRTVKQLEDMGLL